MKNSGKDVSENQAAEQMSQAVVEMPYGLHYSMLMDAPVGISIFSGPDPVYRFANVQVQNLLRRQDLIGKQLSDVLPDPAGRLLIESIQSAFHNGETGSIKEFSVAFDLEGGESKERFFDVSYQPLRDATGHVEGVMTYSYEVTDSVLSRKRSEDAMKRMEGQKHVLELLLERAPLSEILVPLTLAAEAKSTGGRSTILLLDRAGRHLIFGAAPNLPEELNRAVDGMPIGPDKGICARVAYAGKALVVYDMLKDPHLQDYYELIERLGFRACWSIPILSSQGKVLGTFATYYSEPRNPDPEERLNVEILARTAALAIERYRDEEELRETQAKLEQAQKMESIGLLAGGIAHDFNNILTAINGYAAISLRQLNSGDSLYGNLYEIKSAGERAAALTRQLLAFSRKQMLKPMVLNMNDLVVGMYNMLKRIIGEDIEFNRALDPGLGWIKADPGQMEQVILNLVVNARDATPAGGRIMLATGNVDIGRDECEGRPELQTGPYIQLTVQDSGHGIESSLLGRIFEPFFTTKPLGTGSGMGLPMVQGIITQSGGHISVESRPGLGTKFKVILPIVAAAMGKNPAEEADTVSEVKSAETILLVEDDRRVRKLARDILEMDGYTVIEAANGEEGLKMSDARPGGIDLLLTDMIMPRLRGRDLAEMVLRKNPDIAVLFMSGYIEDALIVGGLAETPTHFIQKPFLPNQLAKAVRSAIDSKTRTQSARKQKS